MLQYQCDVGELLIRNGVVKAGVPSQGNVMVAVDLPSAKVTSVQQLARGLVVASLWASYNDKTKIDTLGGSAMLNVSSVGYGTITAAGKFSVTGKVELPPTMAITALLSQPVYFFTLYPEGTLPGGPAVTGYVVFGNFKGSSLKMVPIQYYLAGARREA